MQDWHNISPWKVVCKVKPIIIDMEEMSDSTEVYGTRPSPIFGGIIYTLTILLLLAGVWMRFFQIDIITHAHGMIQNNEATATLTNITAGKLVECRAEDGSYVRRGDRLFVVDTEELQQQEKQCGKELENINNRIEMLDVYHQALAGDSDVLYSEKDNCFYEEYATRYQAVLLNCDSVHKDVETQRSQYQTSIDSLDVSIQMASSDETKLNQMLSDIRNRTNSFSKEEVYYYAAIEEYIKRYHLTENQYDAQIIQLKEAGSSENEDTASQEKVESLRTEKEQALSRAEAEMLASIEQSLASTQGNLENLKASRSEAENHLNNLQSGSEQLSADLIIVNELNAVFAELNTYKNKQSEYEATLSTLNNRMAEGIVTAQIDGYLNLTSDKVQGDYVGAGEMLGSIVPEEDESYKAVIYVENQDIGKIHEGQTVRYEVPAYSSAEYGLIKGTIQKISKDMKVNKENGSGYYELEASITYEGGKQEVEFMQGMALEAKVVTDKKNVMDYLLEKIDLLDN